MPPSILGAANPGASGLLSMAKAAGKAIAAGGTTSVDLPNGGTVTLSATRADGTISVTRTLTGPEGQTRTGTVDITRDDDGILSALFRGPNGGTREVTIDREAGTRTVETTRPDGTVVTVEQSVDRDARTRTSEIDIDRPDGTSGNLTVVESRTDGARTVSLDGSMPDGTLVDSTLVFAEGRVTVTDFEGDTTSWSVADFRDLVREVGLIGVVADVEPTA